jgi:CheY-like chemotaxis protein
MDISSQPLAVLVVDDEPLIRMDLAATMEDAGFKVYEAANADRAIELLENRPDIYLLFTDVDMPGSMNGVELAHYARSYWPVKIIVSSGYRKVETKDLPPGAIFLGKPTRPAHVIAQLRSMLV